MQSGNALARQVGRPEQNEPQLIVVLFDGKTDLYKQVKQVAETKLGVLTSCADTKRCLQRLNKQYCGMWALKTVSKLKGVVWQPTSQTLDKFGAKGVSNLLTCCLANRLDDGFGRRRYSWRDVQPQTIGCCSRVFPRQGLHQVRCALSHSRCA